MGIHRFPREECQRTIAFAAADGGRVVEDFEQLLVLLEIAEQNISDNNGRGQKALWARVRRAFGLAR